MKPDKVQNLIESSENMDTTFLGTHTSSLGVEEDIGVEDEKRVLNVLNIGPTGYGKTQLMAHAILQDIYKGHGIAVVNPKGGLINQIIAKMPEDRHRDIIYINPGQEPVTPINVLEPHTTEDMTTAQRENQKEIIISDLIDLFKRQTDNWGERWGRVLETLLRAHIDLNIQKGESNSLLDVFQCVIQDEALTELIDRTEDKVVREQLVRVKEDMGSYELEPLQRRLNDFVMNSTIREFVSAEESGVNFREALDEEKIILVEIQKGEIGSTVSELVGSIVVTKVWAAAQSRITQEPEDRTPFYLYVDELQNFGSEGSALATMLSEAREYKLGCWLATQYLSNLDSKKMREAVINNCRTKIVFDPTGSENENRLARILNGVDKADLGRLKQYRAVLQTPAEGDEVSQAVVFDTYPPYKGDRGRVEDWKDRRAVTGSKPGVDVKIGQSLGKGNNAGNEFHRELLKTAKQQLEELPGTQVQLLYQDSGADKPDGKVLMPEGVAHLEAENSTLSKPVKVLKNYLRATEEGCECIFVVEEGNAVKLQNIISDPVNRQGSDHEDDEGSYSYYSGEDGEFTDIGLLEDEGEYRIIKVDTEELEATVHEDNIEVECPQLDNYSEEELGEFCMERDKETGYCSALGQQCVLTETDD